MSNYRGFFSLKRVGSLLLILPLQFCSAAVCTTAAGIGATSVADHRAVVAAVVAGTLDRSPEGLRQLPAAAAVAGEGSRRTHFGSCRPSGRPTLWSTWSPRQRCCCC